MGMVDAYFWVGKFFLRKVEIGLDMNGMMYYYKSMENINRKQEGLSGKEMKQESDEVRRIRVTREIIALRRKIILRKIKRETSS